jgi:tRNA pseudouridine38-40 synthase
MFSKVNTDVNTFDCTIYEAYWKQENNNYLRFPLIAFENMVRSIVGTLVNVGLKKNYDS